LGGGNIGQGALKGAIGGSINGIGGNGMDDLDGSYTARDENGELVHPRDTSPGFIPSYYGGNTSGQSSENPASSTSDNPFSSYIDKAIGLYKNADGSWNGKRMDSTVNGLMGLYGGYKRRQAASGLLRGMDQRRNDYSTALQSELMRKDAATGRRSAYDTRGVELNARLAALDAQQAPALMNASNSQLSGMFNMLSSGYGVARDMGAFGKPQEQPPTSPYLPSTFAQPPTPNYSLGNSLSQPPDQMQSPYSLRPRNKLFGGT
jgi:hypothetical protein